MTSYAYDALGNLRRVGRPDGVEIRYLVDGRHRRVGKLVNGTLVKGWVYGDQLRPIAELDATGAVVARFVYGVRPNVPDYLVTGGVTYRIIADHLGSPRVIVNAATGAVAQRLDYDPFGVVTQDSAPGWQPFGYAGGLYDPDTRLVRFGARDYDAETGRWTAKDPVLFEAGLTNLYSHALADPINWVGLGRSGSSRGVVREPSLSAPGCDDVRPKGLASQGVCLRPQRTGRKHGAKREGGSH